MSRPCGSVTERVWSVHVALPDLTVHLRPVGREDLQADWTPVHRPRHPEGFRTSRPSGCVTNV